MARVALAFPACHRRGGVERVFVEVANYLATRHEVHVFASETDKTAILQDVVQHHVPTYFPGLAGKLQFAKKADALIHDWFGTNHYRLGTFGVVSPIAGVQWVQSVHQRWMEVSRTTRDTGGRLRQRINPFHWCMLKRERMHFGERRYKRLIALTTEVKNDLHRFYQTPLNDISVLPNGFSPNEFNVSVRNKRAEVRAKIGIDNAVPLVLFVANELERKGYYPLLDALKQLPDKSIQLLAVGRFDKRKAQAAACHRGLEKRVRFAPSTATIADYYAAADVFALPTKYEAWGLVIVEALACGLPVVVSRLAGAASAVDEGRSGYLINDPGNAAEIAQYLKIVLGGSCESCDWISSSVNHLSWDKVLSRYESILLNGEADAELLSIPAIAHE